MKKIAITFTLLVLPLHAFDTDEHELKSCQVHKGLVAKRTSKKTSTERTITPTKLTTTIDQLFDQYLKANNLNPVCVEQYMKKELNKAKRALANKLSDQLEMSYRSEHLFKDVDGLVQTFFKTFILRVQHVLTQAWVLSVVEDGKSTDKINAAMRTRTNNSSIFYSKKTNDLFNQLTYSRAKGNTQKPRAGLKPCRG